RFGNIGGEERSPRRRQVGSDDRIVLNEPGKMAQAVLDDGADRDVARRDRRLRSGELGPLDRDARHRPDEAAVDDDDEAQEDRVAVAPPRGRMNEDRWPDDLAND